MSADDFRSFEAAGWNEVAHGYASSDVVSGLVGSAVPFLADAVGIRPGMRVLDLACGPGAGVVEALRRGAEVVAVDIADEMVAIARERAPSAEFHVAPAEDLPLPAASVDAVMCGFGLPHFAEPEAVLAEALRVTRPMGRVAFATWCRPDQVPFFGIVFVAVAELGSLDVPLPEGPDMFRFSDEAEATSSLSAAGFVNVSVRELPLTVAVSRGSDAMDLVTRATVRTRALYEAQDASAQEAIARHVASSVEELRGPDGTLRVAMPAVLITASVPNS